MTKTVDIILCTGTHKEFQQLTQHANQSRFKVWTETLKTLSKWPLQLPLNSKKLQLLLPLFKYLLILMWSHGWNLLSTHGGGTPPLPSFSKAPVDTGGSGRVCHGSRWPCSPPRALCPQADAGAQILWWSKHQPFLLTLQEVHKIGAEAWAQMRLCVWFYRNHFTFSDDSFLTYKNIRN